MRSQTLPAPFIAQGSEVLPTSAEIERREIRYKRLRQIGVEPFIITESEEENPYRVKAMVLVNQDKEIPDDLIKNMKKYDEKMASDRQKKEKSNKKQ